MLLSFLSEGGPVADCDNETTTGNILYEKLPCQARRPSLCWTGLADPNFLPAKNCLSLVETNAGCTVLRL